MAVGTFLRKISNGIFEKNQEPNRLTREIDYQLNEYFLVHHSAGAAMLVFTGFV